MSGKALTRQFPVHSSDSWWRRSIPWDFIAPHEGRARMNHGGQSLECLARRGGLSVDEIYAVVNDTCWQLPSDRLSITDMAACLNRQIEEHDDAAKLSNL
jgi:hypothetical protein